MKWFVFVVATALGASHAWANDVCDRALRAQVFSDYSFEQLRRPYRHFSPDQTPYVLSGDHVGRIRNQCRYGSCWAQAALAV